MIPYNESDVIAFGDVVRQQYVEAGRIPNAQYPTWIARVQYDACAGMTWAASCAKHLKELRIALGLPVPEPPAPVPGTVPELAIAGTSFIDVKTGKPWPWRSVTAFKLFQAWLEGDMERVKNYTAWMRRNQIRMARVFGMFNGGLGRFVPAEYKSYWRGLPEFFEAMAGEGFAVEFTIFADMQTDLLKTINQPNHYAKVRDIVAPAWHVVTELCNEPAKNGVDVAALKVKDPRVVQATGAYDSDDIGTYTYPTLDFVTDHTPRDDEWPRKARRLQETSDALHIPCVADEPMGVGRVLPPPASQQRSMVASDHAEYHALASLFGAGSTIHGTFGNELRLPDTEEQAVIDAVTMSWNVIPAEVHEAWQYTRVGLADSPLADTGSLRTYAMLSPDRSAAWAVEIRPTQPPQAAPGWRIVATHGFGGCVIECGR